MSFFKWQPTFDVGVEEMNQEHQQLMQLMNRLYELNDKKAAKLELRLALKALGDFTVRHFSDEEKYMASIQYQGLDTHKIIHQNLLKQFGEHVDRFEKGGDHLSPQFFEFLRFWLSAHIQGVDIKYGDFAKKKSA